MAAPRFAPVRPDDEPRDYSSPPAVPDPWAPDRPAEIHGFQPSGVALGYQGPDQGYALRIAERLRPELRVSADEHVDDAISGCVAIGLRRASLFSRAPVVHDLRIAFTAWGFFDDAPPADLVTRRTAAFDGLRRPDAYTQRMELVAAFPEATLRMTPEAVAAAYPARWQALLDG